MLDVSFNLAAIAAMLLGIVDQGIQIKIDGLNSPTARPIPRGHNHLGMSRVRFKRLSGRGSAEI